MMLLFVRLEAELDQSAGGFSAVGQIRLNASPHIDVVAEIGREPKLEPRRLAFRIPHHTEVPDATEAP